MAEEKVPEEAVPEVEVTEEAEEEEEAEAEEEPPLSYFATWPVPLHTSKQVAERPSPHDPSSHLDPASHLEAGS